MSNSLIGKEYLIRDKKHNSIVGARYIDNGRRVRITSGVNNGEVLQRFNFEILEKIENGNEMEALLGLVWDND